ncbi:MAG: hypothetical protein U0670_12555 [Anaerolineae bacterium]
MRRFLVLVVLIAILLVGGGLTVQLLSSNGSLHFPVLTQTAQPDASPTTVLPWKAEQFFLLVGFLLFNLVGIAATLALIFWLVDRGLRRSKADAEQKQQSAATGAQ